MILPTRRIVVLRASRDTLTLIACTIGVTLALAYAVRQHPASVAATPAPALQVWAGQLAEVSPDPAVPLRPEPMTSESMVVPKAAMVLPPAQPLPHPPGRTPCDGAACSAKVSGVPVPPARQRVAALDPAAAPKLGAEPAQPARPPRDKRIGLSDLNPLHHLPDAVRKPFSYAGNKISGWIDWF